MILCAIVDEKILGIKKLINIKASINEQKRLCDNILY